MHEQYYTKNSDKLFTVVGKVTKNFEAQKYLHYCRTRWAKRNVHDINDDIGMFCKSYRSFPNGYIEVGCHWGADKVSKQLNMFCKREGEEQLCCDFFQSDPVIFIMRKRVTYMYVNKGLSELMRTRQIPNNL